MFLCVLDIHSVNDIMLALQKMNFQPDFAPMKLRSAYGEAVCKVLDFLCDQALNTQNFTFDAPIYPTEDHYEDAVAADGAEVSSILTSFAAAVSRLSL